MRESLGLEKVVAAFETWLAKGKPVSDAIRMELWQVWLTAYLFARVEQAEGYDSAMVALASTRLLLRTLIDRA
jgi:hypothetical protein